MGMSATMCSSFSLGPPSFRVASFDVGLKNLGIWVGQFVPSHRTFPFRFSHWELLNLGTLNLHEATVTLVHEFERRPFLAESDWILIENQIDDVRGGGGVFKAGRMKAMGQAIAAYFLTKRLGTHHQDSSVLFVSARNKLKVWDCMGFQEPLTLGERIRQKKAQYYRNKQMAIVQTRALLQRGEECQECNPKWRDYFDNLTKQDDVADAFLQAAYWILKREKWNNFGSRGAGVADEDSAEFW